MRRITVEELKTFKGYEHLTLEQAEKTIDTLVSFGQLFISLYQTKRGILECAISGDLPTTISLNSKSEDHGHANAA